MDTIVDSVEQQEQQHSRRSSGRMKVHAGEGDPRAKLYSASAEDVPVEWFAREGPFEKSEAPAPAPATRDAREVEAPRAPEDALPPCDDARESDTLLLATRRWVRAGIWTSED